MIKYILRVYDHYVPLIRETGTLEQAITAALEVFNDGEIVSFDDDLDFEILEVSAAHKYNTSDYQDFFDKKLAAWKKQQQEQQDRLDRANFERLKKKFECTCREKEVDKTNCPTHREFGS